MAPFSVPSRNLTHFFDAIPANRQSYGGNTMAYLEILEEPEEIDTLGS